MLGGVQAVVGNKKFPIQFQYENFKEMINFSFITISDEEEVENRSEESILNIQKN